MFPWEKLPSDSIVVDVGGGIGSQTLPIARAYPNLKFVVQDREAVVKDAEIVSNISVARVAEELIP